MKVAVIGGGVMGSILCYYLLRKNIKVDLYEKGSFLGEGSAGWRAGGMIAPFCELERAEQDFFQYTSESLKEWMKIDDFFEGELKLKKSGTIIIPTKKEGVELIQLKKILSRRGLKISDFSFLSHDFLKGKDEVDCLFFKKEGSLQPCRFFKVMGNFFKDQLEKLFFNKNIESIESFMKQRDSYSWIIDCRGMGANKEIPGLRGVRGEIIDLECRDVNIPCTVRILGPRYPIYIIPRDKGLFTVGATEIESDDRSSISVRSTMELLSSVYTFDTRFSEARILGTFAQVRPTTYNNYPIINIHQKIIRINGLYRHGFLLAPLLAQDTVDFLCTGKKPPFTKG